MPVKKHRHAAVASKRSMSSFWDMTFSNPYIDNDYDTLEDLWANTLAGTVIDEKIGFDFGAGIKPTIKLINPKEFGDEEAQKNAIEEYSDSIDTLIKFDNKKKIRFPNKYKDAARMMKVFGRCALAKEFGRIGKAGKDLPTALKPLHSRDLGRVNVHQDDWSLSSVQAFNKKELLRENEMVYLVNMPNSPRKRSMHYGFSEIQRVVGESLALRKLLEFDGPEIAETMWAGYGLVTVDTISKSPEGAKAELEVIRQGSQPGALNFISGKKDDITYQNFDTNARIRELVELAKFYEKEIIGHSGLPGAFLGREEESNMATLFGKIRMFIAGPVRKDREQLSAIAQEQWYDPNLKIFNPELAEIITIEPEFEPVVLESWIDVVDSLGKLKAIFPSLPEKELLNLANLPELQDKLGENAAITPDMIEIAKAKEKQQRTNPNEFEKGLPTNLLSPEAFPKQPMAPASTIK